jgi:hypothetical protein
MIVAGILIITAQLNNARTRPSKRAYARIYEGEFVGMSSRHRK